MAVKEVTGQISQLYGLSTDTKPTGSTLMVGSTFWALDTKQGYIYDGISTWYPAS